MEKFVKGAVVVLDFPFSDFSTGKRRPALVVASTGSNVIVCQITSQAKSAALAVVIDVPDFLTGGLARMSYINVPQLFTVEAQRILYQAAVLRPAKTTEAIEKLVRLIQAG
jgi:mRNA interferase MazF